MYSHADASNHAVNRPSLAHNNSNFGISLLSSLMYPPLEPPLEDPKWLPQLLRITRPSRFEGGLRGFPFWMSSMDDEAILQEREITLKLFYTGPSPMSRIGKHERQSMRLEQAYYHRIQSPGFLPCR